MKEQQIQSGTLKKGKQLLSRFSKVGLSLVTIAVLAVLFTGCASKDAATPESDPLKTPFSVGPNTEPAVKAPTSNPPSN